MFGITALTKDCPREDCSVSYDGSTSTLAGWMQTYDKQGNPQSRDPNTTMSHLHCVTCGKMWKVASRAGQEDVITAHDLQKSEQE